MPQKLFLDCSKHAHKQGISQGLSRTDIETGGEQPNATPAGRQTEWVTDHGYPGEQQDRPAMAGDPFQRAPLLRFFQAAVWKTTRQPPAKQPAAEPTEGIAQCGKQPKQVLGIRLLVERIQQHSLGAAGQEGGRKKTAEEQGGRVDHSRIILGLLFLKQPTAVQGVAGKVLGSGLSGDLLATRQCGQGRVELESAQIIRKEEFTARLEQFQARFN